MRAPKYSLRVKQSCSQDSSPCHCGLREASRKVTTRAECAATTYFAARKRGKAVLQCPSKPIRRDKPHRAVLKVSQRGFASCDGRGAD